jgi:DNA primase
MDAVDEIKRRVDLAEYIGRQVRLIKTGRNFKALCPFHAEKTPSFHVFPDRGTWRCFGSCGEGGDLFSFVQKRDGLDFRGALRLLAAEAGVQLSPEAAARRSRADHLAGIVSAAVDFYQRCFEGPEGAAARTYATATRGLTAEAIAAFRLGWAPEDWRLLRDHLATRGYDEKDGIAAGLLVEPDTPGSTPYDRFRGRLIIPIADERGTFVAMGGRGLHGEEPKYLNSPQTEIFDKGRTLFGLHLAADAIRAAGTAVVVEGYMDVIGPWQAGFRNVVATMGTSITEQHATLLQRWARRVVLAMDPDAAGMAAVERAGSLFVGLGNPQDAARSARSAEALVGRTDLDLRVAPLAPGRDPDEVARDDPEGWRAAIEGAMPYAEFLVWRLLSGEHADGPVEARRAVDRLRPVLLAVSDPVERARYVQRVARHLGVNEQAVFERLRPPRQRTGWGESPPAEAAPTSPEEVLLALFLRHPGLRGEYRSLPDHLFTGSLDRELFRRWVHGDELGPADDPVEARRTELTAKRLPPLTERQAARAVKEKIRDITRERVIEHQAAVSEQLAEAERTLGSRGVAEIASHAWRGAMPPPEHRDIAETVMEDLQLGLSIHRHEDV